MSTKKKTTVYKKNKKPSKYGGKKSRRTTRRNKRTKKGGVNFPYIPQEIGTRMIAEKLLDNPQQYIGRVLRCPDLQEAGVIENIVPNINRFGYVEVSFKVGTGYQSTIKVEIPKNWTIYIEQI
jgi:hypothetical protein